MTAAPIDLATASVFFDFDGTITTVDIGCHLLDRLVGPAWHELDARYARGEIGSRELLTDEWALVEGDEALARSVAAEIAIDPAFAPLVHALQAAGAEVVVISDGFGFYVEDACQPLGIEVLTNDVDFATGEVRFPHEDRCCPCSSCGVCKQAPIKDAQWRGRTTVLVGDGTSDRKAALLADHVFAKGDLASWCRAFGVAFRPFTTLVDVAAALVG